MITSPLELKRYLTEPDLRFDTVPLLDLCLIGLFLAFQSSRFIASPGITLDIPDVDKEVLSGIPTSAVVTVLTVRENDMVLFEGNIVRPRALEREFSKYFEMRKKENSVILIKLDKSVRVDSLLRILDLARRSGFAQVQIAAEEKMESRDFQLSKGGG